MALSIITLNVNGLRDVHKCAGVLQWLQLLPSPVDVVCLQETHCSSVEECTRWFSATGLSCVASVGSSHSCGTVVLFRPRLSLVRSWTDNAGRFVQCELSLQSTLFRVACIYAPNRNPARDDFFADVETHVDPSVPTLLCGDFNAVFDRQLDRVGSDPSVTVRESSATLSGLFAACCVLDIWRFLHRTQNCFTWSRWNGLVASRIDLFGVPFSWVPAVSTCDILPFSFSDHCAVHLSVSVPETIVPGPGLWKLNLVVLDEPEYLAMISNFWTFWRTRCFFFPSLEEWWDEGKREIKRLSVAYCKRRASAKRSPRDLVRLAEFLKSQVDSGAIFCFGPYQSTLSSLAKLDLESARGAQVRSRSRWVEEGESSSSYFFQIVKKQSADRLVSALRLEDESIVNSADDLVDVFANFYSSLFTAEEVDCAAQEELLSKVSVSLSSEQSEVCEGALSVEECFSSLKGMAHRKAPGNDGLPMEFYVKFWSVLGADLVRVLNFCFTNRRLSKSQRRGVISLSFKKGDRLDPRNWRPISLLNVDYKIASRAIAGRLLKVLHVVVGRDQTCGVPGRFIGENVAFLRDIVDYASRSGTPCAILSLDQEKAFDRVDWGFMKATLSRMGFGPSFISWVDLFYVGAQSAVNVNGYVSPYFSLSRGVRQGCPLSPLLYVLVAEVLACNIRSHPGIAGLSLPTSAVSLPSLSLYADDTSVVVTSVSAITATFDVYELYEKGSGAKLNLAKCKGLWLGSWNGRVDTPVALEWSSAKVKILGVFLGPLASEEDNWRPRITAVQNVLSSWRQRFLSFRGKALVINALALSRIWYVASLIHMPQWVLRELNQNVFCFFWSGKPDLVTRKVIAQPPSSGGFSVVDIQSKVWALLLQWVRRFLLSPSTWVSFLSYWCDLGFAASPMQVLSYPPRFPGSGGLPDFYFALLSAWRAIGGAFWPNRGSLCVGSGLLVSPVSSLSTKSTYLVLLSDRSEAPHCVEKFLPSFGPLYWPSTWRQLFFFDIDRQVIDLSWKIAHGVLYTAERLSSFGYTIPTARFCGCPLETLDHLFFYCPLADSVLSWLSSLLFRSFPAFGPILLRHVRFGFSEDELLCVPRFFVYALNVCKFSLWTARNDFRFRDVQPGAIAVLERAKTRLRFHLPLFFRRFKSSRRKRYFARQWCANGVACLVRDGRLVVLI